MSLRFEFGAIKNYEILTKNVLDENQYHPVTERMIWLCMSVSMRSITEKNAEEFFWRVRLLQMINGRGDMSFNDQEVYLTLQDIKDHIGLSTNVSEKNRNRWLTENVGKEVFNNPDQMESAHEIIDRRYAAVVHAKTTEERV